MKTVCHPQLSSRLRLVYAAYKYLGYVSYCGVADFPSANKDVYTHLGVGFLLSLTPTMTR